MNSSGLGGAKSLKNSTGMRWNRFVEFITNGLPPWDMGVLDAHWIAMGTDTSLVVATKTAIREMVKLLQEKKGLTETQAYQAASMAADLHITELVDGNVGVHMMIAKRYLR